jgi:penicillin G amidase
LNIATVAVGREGNPWRFVSDYFIAAVNADPTSERQRPEIAYNHTLLGEVHSMPWSNRSTYAHVVEYGSTGPVNIKSMFPLGISGNISGPPPAFDEHFFSMVDVFDMFVYRDFPLFVP